MALLRQAIADIERGVKNCETAQQKRAFLAGVRDGSELDEQAYLAFCADRTGEIVGEDVSFFQSQLGRSQCAREQLALVVDERSNLEHLPS